MRFEKWSCSANWRTKHIYALCIAATLILVLSIPHVVNGQSASASHQFGIGIGEVLPESVVAIKALVDLPAASWLTARGNLEIASIFGTVVLPLEAEAIFPLRINNRLFTPYLGVGGALVFTASDFGLRADFGVNGLVGARINAQLPLFLQAKVRIYGSRTTYQFDAGVMF